MRYLINVMRYHIPRTQLSGKCGGDANREFPLGVLDRYVGAIANAMLFPVAPTLSLIGGLGGAGVDADDGNGGFTLS